MGELTTKECGDDRCEGFVLERVTSRGVVWCSCGQNVQEEGGSGGRRDGGRGGGRDGARERGSERGGEGGREGGREGGTDQINVQGAPNVFTRICSVCTIFWVSNIEDLNDLYLCPQ